MKRNSSSSVLMYKKNIDRLFKAAVLLFLLSYPLAVYSQVLSTDEINKKVSQSVVLVRAYDNANKITSQGCGIIYNDEGWAIANYSIISGKSKFEVLKNGQKMPVKDIVGISVDLDIVIIKVDPGKGEYIATGDSKNITAGKKIYTIDITSWPATDIMQGTVKDFKFDYSSETGFIEIPEDNIVGNGPVLNEKGELVGFIQPLIRHEDNIVSVIPINDLKFIKTGSYLKNNAYKDFEMLEKGHKANHSGNYNEAISIYSNFIKKHPNVCEAYYGSGQAKNWVADYKEAIKDFTKAIELNSEQVKFYIGRAYSEELLSNYSAALLDYNMVLSINPNLDKIYNMRGETKNMLNDYKNALQDFNAAVKLNPNEFSYFLNRATSRFILEDNGGAIEDYTKALKLDSSIAGVYSQRATVKAKLHDFKGAIADYKKSVELDPTDVWEHIDYGLVLAAVKDFRTAKDEYTKAIQNSEKTSYAYLCRGMAEYELSEYSNTIADCTRALEIDTVYSNAYYYRGLAKQKLGDTSGALEDWKIAKDKGIKEADDMIKKYQGK